MEILTLKANSLVVSGSRTESSAREVLGVTDSGTVTTHSRRLNRGATSFSSPSATTTVPVPIEGRKERENKINKKG